VSTSKFDARQTVSADSLNQLTTAAGAQLDNLLRSIDSNETPPLKLSVTGTNKIIDIGSIFITNPETLKNRTIPVITTDLPSFSGGTITAPATGAGTITVSPGNNLVIAMTANQYLKVGINLDAAGDISLTQGIADSTLSSASAPRGISNTFGIGYFVLRTDSSNDLANIQPSDIYQYTGGGGSGASGGGAINLLDNFDFEGTNEAAIPSDWVASSAEISIIATSTDPLRGARSGRIAATSSVTLADYVAVPFTLPNAYKSRSMGLQFEYEAGAGYDVGDAYVVIRDVVAAVDIYPNTSWIQGGVGRFYETWTASNNTSYELRIYSRVAASAWVLKIDDIVVNAEKKDEVFAVTSFSATGCSLKGGYRLLDDKRVLASGSGTTKATLGVDIVVNLGTVLAASSLSFVADKRYALAIDLATIISPTLMTDIKREVLAWEQSNLRMFVDTLPAAIDPRRYVILNEIYVPAGAGSWEMAEATHISGVHDTMAAYFPYVERYTTTITTELAATNYPHGLSAEPQMVQLYYYDGSTKIGLDLSAHLVNKDGTNLSISTLGLTFGGGRYVEAHAHYTPTIPNVAVAQKTYTSPWMASASPATLTHGLNDMEDIRGISVIERDMVTGRRRIIDPSILVENFDATTIYLEWTGVPFTSGGGNALEYRVVAGNSPAVASVLDGAFNTITNRAGDAAPSFPFPIAGSDVQAAGPSNAGVLTTTSQTLPGPKTFTDPVKSQRIGTPGQFIQMSGGDGSTDPFISAQASAVPVAVNFPDGLRPSLGSSAMTILETGGSWTPSISFSTSNGTASVNVSEGRYARINNMIFFTGRLSFNKGTGSGLIRIGGLPVGSGGVSFNAVAVHTDGGVSFGSPRAFVQGYVAGALIHITFAMNSGASAVGVDSSDMGASPSFFVSGCYSVS